MKKITMFDPTIDPTIDPNDLIHYDSFEVERAFPVE